MLKKNKKSLLAVFLYLVPGHNSVSTSRESGNSPLLNVTVLCSLRHNNGGSTYDHGDQRRWHRRSWLAIISSSPRIHQSLQHSNLCARFVSFLAFLPSISCHFFEFFTAFASKIETPTLTLLLLT